ncbi:hypothetical protein F4859DRAFT_525524 [Xylaria cf. heliscus]|nr:hypothetical protein F4859DRAFT_525524 [Xylaria cf. heliscus]
MSDTAAPVQNMLGANEQAENSPSWFWSCDSEAHACKDKSLFKEFTTFYSKVQCWSLTGPSELAVCGVGTVELSIQQPSSPPNQTSQKVLYLVDVLYVPRLPFNIIAAKLDISDWTVARANSYIYDSDKSLIAYFQTNRNEVIGESDGQSIRSLIELSHLPTGSMIELRDVLARLGVKPSADLAGHAIALSDHPSYTVGKPVISWEKAERMRWEAHKYMRRDSAILTYDSTNNNIKSTPNCLKRERISSTGSNAPTTTTNAQKAIKRVKFNDTREEPPYSLAEKMWLKSTFGSESEYLKRHGLNPNNIKHRNEGRRMARAVIFRDLGHNGVPSDDIMEFELESNPDDSQPNNMLSSMDLKCIRKNWANVASFMEALGLQIGKEDDWEKAASIMRSCFFPTVPQDAKSREGSASPSPAEKEATNSVSKLSLVNVTVDLISGLATDNEVIDPISRTCAEIERMNSVKKVDCRGEEKGFPGICENGDNRMVS